MDTPTYILFDGVCNLCNGSVNFVLDRDQRRQFVFGTLQSPEGAALLKQFGGTPGEMTSILLLTTDPDGTSRIRRESDAILEISGRLHGVWPAMKLFLIIPRPVRDVVYRFIARNRYRWFGTRDSCRIPTPELQDRFIAPLRSSAEVQSTSE